MVHDDDTQPPDPTDIRWDQEPLEYAPPPSRHIEDAIVDLAGRWDGGRLTLFETLKQRYPDLKEEHVNHVLRKHRLPHLHRHR